jgi:hypothetical protein
MAGRAESIHEQLIQVSVDARAFPYGSAPAIDNCGTQSSTYHTIHLSVNPKPKAYIQKTLLIEVVRSHHEGLQSRSHRSRISLLSSIGTRAPTQIRPGIACRIQSLH